MAQERDALVQASLALPAVVRHLPRRRLEALLHARDVATGAERRALAGEYYGAHGVVGGHAFEGRVKLAAHRIVDRVAHFGPIERDRGDRRGERQFDARSGCWDVGHGARLLWLDVRGL